MTAAGPLGSTSNARAIEVDPLLDDRWDEFVERHPRATVHHLGAWAGILASCYRYKPRYIALQAGDALVGVLPLVSSGRRLSGSRLSSLPTAKAAGPLAANAHDERALLAAALEVKQREGLSSMTLRSQSPALEGEAVHVDGVSSTQILELGRPAEELLDSYKRENANLYRSIRKAAKSGLVVTETQSLQELREWYRLYLLTIRRHRTLPRRLAQLQDARAQLGAHWRLITVKKDGAVVAGGVFHDIAGTVELMYNASDHGSLSLRPNHALYWHVITDSIERGRAGFDFGVSNHETLERFKQQWGTASHDVYVYSDRDMTAAEKPGSAPTQSDGAAKDKVRLAARIKGLSVDLLARSPIAVSRAAGAVAFNIF